MYYKYRIIEKGNPNAYWMTDHCEQTVFDTFQKATAALHNKGAYFDADKNCWIDNSDYYNKPRQYTIQKYVPCYVCYLY